MRYGPAAARPQLWVRMSRICCCCFSVYVLRLLCCCCCGPLAAADAAAAAHRITSCAMSVLFQCGGVCSTLFCCLYSFEARLRAGTRLVVRRVDSVAGTFICILIYRCLYLCIQARSYSRNAWCIKAHYKKCIMSQTIEIVLNCLDRLEWKEFWIFG